MTTTDDPFKFGIYWIGQNYEVIPGRLFDITHSIDKGIKPYFPDEKIYSGETIVLFEVEWDAIIGVTNGRVYKISLLATFQYKPGQNSPVNFIDHVTHDLVSEFSQFQEQTEIENTLATIWDTSWGNIVLTQTPRIINSINLISNNISIVITATGKFPFISLA